MGEAAENLPSYRVGPGHPPIETRFGGPRSNALGTPGPTGRLMARVREAFDDGEALIPILKASLSGTSYKERLLAVQIILERGWGKAPQPVVMGGDKGQVGLDLTKISPDDFKLLAGLLNRILSSDGRPADTGVLPGS